MVTGESLAAHIRNQTLAPLRAVFGVKSQSRRTGRYADTATVPISDFTTRWYTMPSRGLSLIPASDN